MRAIRVTQHGGPEVLTVAEIDRPEPGAGEAVVKVAAAGVNFIDTYLRSGLYPSQPPFTPGSEAAGEVAAVGPDVTGVQVGDRVVGTELRGAYAEYAVTKADRLVPVPDGVTDEQAAAVVLQGMTAHYLLFDSYPVRAGETVLVHAGAGGMGQVLTQLATTLGARVIATVSTPEKEKLAREAGAVAVLRYEEVPDKVRELTGGEGVAAVYDGVGRTTFDSSLASLRRRGHLVLYGYASGPIPPFDINRLQTGGSLFLTRPTLAHYIVSRAELRTRAEDILGRVAAGTLRVRVDHRYPLADAAQAHEDLQARRTTGKLLLIP